MAGTEMDQQEKSDAGGMSESKEPQHRRSRRVRKSVIRFTAEQESHHANLSTGPSHSMLSLSQSETMKDEETVAQKRLQKRRAAMREYQRQRRTIQRRPQREREQAQQREYRQRRLQELTAAQRQAQRQRNTEIQRLIRAKWSEDKRQEQRRRNTELQRQIRARRSEEERQQHAEYVRQIKARRSKEERQLQRQRHAEHMRQIRARRSEEERQLQRQRHTEYVRQLRARRSEEEQQLHRQRHAEYMRQLRARRSEEKRQEQRRRNTELQRQIKARHSEEERQLQRQRHAEYMHQIRASRSLNKGQLRKTKLRQGRKACQRSEGTAEELTEHVEAKQSNLGRLTSIKKSEVRQTRQETDGPMKVQIKEEPEDSMLDVHDDFSPANVKTESVENEVDEAMGREETAGDARERRKSLTNGAPEDCGLLEVVGALGSLPVVNPALRRGLLNHTPPSATLKSECSDAVIQAVLKQWVNKAREQLQSVCSRVTIKTEVIDDDEPMEEPCQEGVPEAAVLKTEPSEEDAEAIEEESEVIIPDSLPSQEELNSNVQSGDPERSDSEIDDDPIMFVAVKQDAEDSPTNDHPD